MFQIRSQMRTNNAHSPKSRTLTPTMRSSVPMIFQFFSFRLVLGPYAPSMPCTISGEIRA